MAEKYSALRFWYCRLKWYQRNVSSWNGVEYPLVSMFPRIDSKKRIKIPHNWVLVLYAMSISKWQKRETIVQLTA